MSKYAESNTATSTNFAGESFEATVNQNRMNLIIGGLVKNYNYIEQAVLREWVSNAHDSHVKSGQTKPIKVTLPTFLNSILTVQDFGCGMSFKEVKEIYAVFYGSDKVEGTGEIGGFGIGGKAALALADQYTMITVKDGLKSVFIFSKSNAGGMSVTPAIVEQPTDEASGVTVSVAINEDRIEQFRDSKLTEVLGGWREDQIEVIGGNFKSYLTDSIEHASYYSENKIFELNDIGNRGFARVLVGPVVYEVDSYFSGRDVDYYDRQIIRYLIPKLEIDSVTFPPSREVIEPTSANKKIIEKAFIEALAEFKKYATEKYSTLSSYKETYEANKAALVRKLNISLEFNGEEVPKTIKVAKSQNIILRGIRDSMASKSVALEAANEDYAVNLDRVYLAIKTDTTAGKERTGKAIRYYLENVMDCLGGINLNSYYNDGLAHGKSVVFDTDLSEWFEAASVPIVKLSEILKALPKESEVKSSTQVRGLRGVNVSPLFLKDKTNDNSKNLAKFLEDNDEVFVIATPYTDTRLHFNFLQLVRILFQDYTKNKVIVSVNSGHKATTLKKLSSKIKDLDDLIKSIDSNDLQTVRNKIIKNEEIADIGLDSAFIQKILLTDDFKKSTKNIFKDWEGDLFRYTSALSSYSLSSKVGSEFFKDFIKSIFAGEEAPTLSYRIRSRYGKPFGLIDGYIRLDNAEALDYIEWSADRYIESQKKIAVAKNSPAKTSKTSKKQEVFV